MTRIPPDSDIVAFGGFDREAPIDQPIPDIVEGALQKVVFCAWLHHFEGIGEKQR